METSNIELINENHLLETQVQDLENKILICNNNNQNLKTKVIITQSL